MEQQAVAITICECGGKFAKAGKRPDGLQRYRCSQCGKTYSDHKQQENILGTKQAVDDSKTLLALQLLVEGNSLRSTERITNIHRDTLMKILVKAGERCEAMMQRTVLNVKVEDVQCDEIWSFVGKKQKNVRGGDEISTTGDAWTFIAIERHSKLILAFELGKRTVESASRFMRKVAVATSDDRFQITTDGLAAYQYAIGKYLGDERCSYAQLIKDYANPTAEDQRRYSAGRIISSESKPISGDPENERICTSHIERQNGSLRQWCKRLTRLTYAFSKKWDNLKAALALHFAYYNFCRVHRSIKKTPAMAAGLTEHVWTLAELLVS